jgi:hypothetical protein
MVLTAIATAFDNVACFAANSVSQAFFVYAALVLALPVSQVSTSVFNN